MVSLPHWFVRGPASPLALFPSHFLLCFSAPLFAPPPTLMICSSVFHTRPVLFATVLHCSALLDTALYSPSCARCVLSRALHIPHKKKRRVIPSHTYLSLIYSLSLVTALAYSFCALRCARTALLCFAIAAGSLVDVRSFVCLYHCSLPPPGRRRSS